MDRATSTLLTLAIVLTACAEAPGGVVPGSTSPTSTVATTPATYATATEPTAPPTTVLTTTGTVGPSATSTSQATTTTLPSGTAPLPTLPDGRPTTFIGVTSEYLAVEVTTATSATVHEFGRTGTREEVETALELGPNVITAAWRLRDGSMIGLVDCCEPAGGTIHYVAAGGVIDENVYNTSGTDGWTLAASPTTAEFARLGYLVGVFDPSTIGDDRVLLFVDDGNLGFPSGQVAWSPDGRTIYWIGIEFGGGPTTLNVVDLTAEAPVPSVVGELDFVGQDQFLGNIATQVSGNLVGFLHTRGDGEITSSTGVVFNPTGELLNTFPVETGSLLGSYDASGKYLIYVDGDGIVRWQGRGQAGELGAGYIHASW